MGVPGPFNGDLQFEEQERQSSARLCAPLRGPQPCAFHHYFTFISLQELNKKSQSVVASLTALEYVV